MSTHPNSYDGDDEGSVTRVIRRLKSGDEDGADLIWERFFPRLKCLVKTRLRTRHRTVSDEEDLALDSLVELFQGLRAGRYEALNNRESVWRLLVTVATRNVKDELSRTFRQKRGGGRVVNESSLTNPNDGETAAFDRIASDTQTPEVRMMIAEECAKMLECLDDEMLGTIALMKVADATNEEIAAALKTSVRTIERRLNDIRKCWERS
ncbi:MAG: ECF-type sigma factor [Planctomycetaceae bacterium]